MAHTDRLNLLRHVGEHIEAFGGIEQALDASGLDAGLRHLVKLRASQINRCAFCIDMHTREARDDGETSARLDRIVVWRDVADFSPRERAALAWTEAMTVLEPRADFEAVHADLAEHFSAVEIGHLSVAIAMINVWNRQIGRAHV